MQNDYNNDRHGGDSLTDAGFFIGLLLFFIAFCGLMYWLVPPIAQFFVGKF